MRRSHRRSVEPPGPSHAPRRRAVRVAPHRPRRGHPGGSLGCPATPWSHCDTFLTTRNATVADLARLLQVQHAGKLDVVAPARSLIAERGELRLVGVGEPSLTPDGVTVAESRLRPTALADAAIADKLGIPGTYLRRLRTEQIGLYDANVNTWLADDPGRRFLVRGLRDPDGGTGIVRALLSDSYRVVDNLDVLMRCWRASVPRESRSTSRGAT